MKKILPSIQAFIVRVFGQITWNKPIWYTRLSNQAVVNPISFLMTMILALSITLALGYGYYWYQHRPHPPRVIAQMTAPEVTPVAKDLIPNVLTIDFGIQSAGFTASSVAPLALIGKEVPNGITMTPEMPGTWVWQSDSRLVFTPNQDWPPAQTYTIQFAKNVFAPHIALASLSYTFATANFQATIADLKFYQDPVNPQIHQVIATVNFNFPVDAESFEKNTQLITQGMSNKVFPLVFHYDENKRTAYLQSDTIPLAGTARYLDLNIHAGVKSLKGKASTKSDVSNKILIPETSRYFKVTQASASIVRNTKDKPEQILTIETTLGVQEAELNKVLHVYLLPQDYPATPVEAAKPNFVWQNPGEVTPAILKLATPVNLKAIPADRDYAPLHSYQFTADATRYLYVTIDSGVHSFGNFVLANSFQAVTKVPEIPKEISFLHKGALLALNSEKKLSVIVRGVPAVKFQIARVLPDNVNQLITQTEGEFNNPKFINQSFNQQNISEIFSTIQSFPTNDLAKEQYTALDIGKYLSTKLFDKGPQGLFLLQATGWDVDKKIPLDVHTERLILITDLGLLVKDNADGSHDVFVQSITQGQPVANVSVAILGKNGLPILTRTTDAQGRANFPNLNDFIDEREPTVYLASLNNDVAFIPYNRVDRQLNFSRFDIGGVNNHDVEAQSLSAYVFSDRGIYRPGDNVHIGMIVKQAFAQSAQAGLPIEVMISDPRGMTVQDKKMTLDATGFITIDFKTQAASPTGQYNINVFIVHDERASSLLGSASVKVAEFLPDTMRIQASLSAPANEGWISPVGLKANANLWNLYGKPAENRKISANILLTPQTVKFSAYPDYIFVDPLLDPKKPAKVVTENLTDGKTNAQGQAEFALNLERFDKSTYQLTFFAEGFAAEGGRSVTAQTVALISPLDYLLGYKADGDLNYIKQKSGRSVQLLAINPQLKSIELKNLKIQLSTLKPITTLVKNPDGTYQYQSLIQTSVVSTQDFAVAAAGSVYALPTQDIGDYLITVLDKNNQEISHFKFSVVGASQVPLAKNAELSVKLNKTVYASDEDIELQITAPYTGGGLITLERDKVYATQWFKTDTTNSIQKIHIPKDFQGNGYVNIAFIRGWDSPEIFISPLSYSIVPFSVTHTQQTVQIALDIPTLAKPGSPFTMTYHSDKPGKIIIYAVDEGILQVARYPQPNPLGFFFQKRALEVLTQQTVDQILPKFLQDRELSAIGGDGGEEDLAKNLNPFKRKTDLPVVFWSGIQDTDATPRQLTYTIPDYFNGTLHVMAVAVAQDAVGAADKTAAVRGNFVITPNTPTFVAPGDEFEITAAIANNVKNSGSNANITSTLTVTPQLELLSPATQSLVIPEGSEQTVHYKLRAKSQLGSAQMTWVANYQDKFSKMGATLSVRPASAYNTTIATGMTETIKKTFDLNTKYYPEYHIVEAAVSTSPLILVSGLKRYLENYPYGCTEQLVSKVFPLLALSNQPWSNDKSNNITDKIAATVQMLSQRQLSSGGFSYWPTVGDNSNNSFASVYAMHFLTEARVEGYSIPNELLRAGITYLKDLASQDVNNLDEARIQAYAIYILTRNEIVTSNYLTNLQLYLNKDPKKTWQQDITSAYIAATYRLLKNDNEADHLIDLYKPEVSANNVETDFYNKQIADAQYLYLLAKHFPDRLTFAQKNLVLPMVRAINDNEINTIFSSYASLALSAYAEAYHTVVPAKLNISAQFAEGMRNLTPLEDNMYQKVNFSTPAKQVVFDNPNKQNYFYQLSQMGYTVELPTSALKHGLEISREFHDTKGNVIHEANLGDEVEVHIQVRALDNYLNNIAIVDLLPGGFEVVRDSVNSDHSEYIDIREDRVIFFGGISPDAVEIVYRIKAINVGNYIVPPIYANSMYNPAIGANSVADQFHIVS